MNSVVEKNTDKKQNTDLLTNRVFILITSIVGSFFLCASPMISLWSGNSDELSAIEGLWLAVLAGIIGVIIAVIVHLLCKKNIYFSGCIVLLIDFFFFDFYTFRGISVALFGFIPEAIGSLIVAAVLITAAWFLINKFKNSDFMSVLFTVISWVIVFISVSNIVSGSFVDTRSIRKEARAKFLNEDVELVDAPEDQPNVYFLLFDEMANAEIMEKYYDLPASENPFDPWLEEHGFNISKSSSSYLDHTVACECNLFTMDYTYTEDTTHEEAYVATADGEWFRALKSLGYKVIQASSHTGDFFMLQDVTGETFVNNLVDGISYDGETVLDMFIDQTVFSLVTMYSGDNVTFLDRLVNLFLNDKFSRVTKYYDNVDNYNKGLTATHSYLMIPHTPFFIDENGETVKATHRCEWENPKYYRDIWFYAVGYAEHIIDDILTNDPDCVIILMSDHGARGGQETSSKRNDIEKEDKCEIMNAVYFRGEEFNIEGLSAVNTMRKVISALGVEYEQVEDGHYIYFDETLGTGKENG